LTTLTQTISRTRAAAPRIRSSRGRESARTVSGVGHQPQANRAGRLILRLRIDRRRDVVDFLLRSSETWCLRREGRRRASWDRVSPAASGQRHCGAARDRRPTSRARETGIPGA
jgi:hypothetical protein